MDKAFIDTTILTDILLKSDSSKKKAADALRRYSKTILPVYAIKEFKAGPLANYIYAHNKLCEVGSYKGTIAALSKLCRTPQRYKTATSLEALEMAGESIAKFTPKEWLEKYGDHCSMDETLCDEAKIAIKYKIFSSWKRLRKTFDKVDFPLDCYDEVAPIEKRKLIERKPTKCRKGENCAAKSLLLQDIESLRKIRNAIDSNSKKDEDIKRRRVLKIIIQHPRVELTDNECRHLGDAVFACLAPPGSVILTTNTKDHIPLAESLGKKVESP